MDFRFFTEKLDHFSRYNTFLHNEINKLREWDALNENKLYELKQKRVYNLIRYAYRHSEFYKNLYKHQFDKRISPGYFNTLPIINKWDIINNNKTICTVPWFLLRVGKTSGTDVCPIGNRNRERE